VKRLGDLLRILRRERRISQRQLADEAGFNSSVVNRAERGGDALFSTWDRLFRGLGHRLRISAKSITVTVEADHPVGPSRSGRSDAGLFLV
jgi:transcriptional regulator with XRE-family HTH domain